MNKKFFLKTHVIFRNLCNVLYRKENVMDQKVNHPKPPDIRTDADIIREILSEKESDSAAKDKIYRILYESSLADEINMDTDLIKECVETIRLIEGDEEKLSAEKIRAMRQKIDLKYKQWRRAELKRRFSIKSAAVIAASLILIFSVTCTVANAFGYNLIQIAVHWGKETFNISAQRPSSMQEADNQNPGNISKSATYDSIEKAFEDIHPKPLLPGWLPDGFAFKYAEKFTRTEDTDILLYYGDSANRVIIFDFVVYKDSDETVRDTSFEKDDNLVQVYEKNNIKHYILKNIDQYQAVWSYSNVVYNINGDISTDEIKKIIDSMYGG